MSSSRTVSALVFSRKNIGEADRLMAFFTREEGLIKVIAKGVRKIPSARGGHLEPCTQVLANITDSKHGLYMGNVETQDYFHALRNDPDAFIRACKHIALFQRLFTEHQAVPELFDALILGWQLYPSLSQEKRIVMDAAIALQIVQYAGVMPDMRLWGEGAVQDKNQKVIKYLSEHPDHAPRIALSEDDARGVARVMNDLLARTVVYS
ncbi:MAG: DNA repair protein RecO [Candidatus Andersenbacteria bacterium]|nr:DNA repair protein RecO [Candidatus Andersenbacteria bacterium]